MGAPGPGSDLGSSAGGIRPGAACMYRGVAESAMTEVPEPE